MGARRTSRKAATPGSTEAERLRGDKAGLWWFLAAVVAVVASLALCRIAGHPFLDWDDQINLGQNPKFNPVTFGALGYYWAHPLADLYIPVTYTVWGLLAFVARDETHGVVSLDPTIFHTASIAFHVLAAARGADGATADGSQALGGHIRSAAICTSSVADGSSGVGIGVERYSGGVWVYLGDLVLSWHVWDRVGAAALGVFRDCHGVVRAGDVEQAAGGLSAGDDARNRIAAAAGKLSPVGIVCGDMVRVGGAAHSDREDQSTGCGAGDCGALWARPLIALDDLNFYTQKLFVPAKLTVDYAHSTQDVLEYRIPAWHWFLFPGALIVASVGFRKAPWMLLGIGIFVAALLPVLGLVPFDFQMYSNVSDHYVYFSMLGVAVIGGSLVEWLHRRGVPVVVLAVAGAIVIAAMAIDTSVEADYWADNFTLFSRNLALRPNSFAANLQVGTHYSKVGDYDRAVEFYQRSLAIKPRDAQAHYDLANARVRQGRLLEAVAEYREALGAWPDHADLHQNLGIAAITVKPVR